MKTLKERMKGYRRKWRLANRPWEIEYQRKRYALNPRGKPKNNKTKSLLTKDRLDMKRCYLDLTTQAILSRRMRGESHRKIAQVLDIPKTTVGVLEDRGIKMCL